MTIRTATSDAPQKRATKRKPLTYYAQIMSVDQVNVFRCMLLDISAKGARLLVDLEDVIPDEFLLVLAPNGKVVRACRLAWRTEDELGASFKDIEVQDVLGTAKSRLKAARLVAVEI
jgi:hypothetical protein